MSISDATFLARKAVHTISTEFSQAQKEGYMSSDISACISAADVRLPNLILKTGAQAVAHPDGSALLSSPVVDDNNHAQFKKLFDGDAIIDLRGMSGDQLRELNKAAMQELKLNPDRLRTLPAPESLDFEKR